MTYQAKNNAYSTLAGSLTNVATTLTVQAGHGDRFPVISAPNHTIITLEDASGNREIVKVTARTAASDSMTIVRAQEGTTARAWTAGDTVSLRMTAGETQTLFDHVDKTAGAHAASAISNTPSGNLAATTVQGALNELQTDVDSREFSINAATAKTTPVDADTTALIDSADANKLKKVTWANIKATLKSYFDTLYIAAGTVVGVTDGDKGDITVSGSGTAWTIDNDAVTFAKMQNINTSKLLGRSTAGSGDVEEISVGSGLTLSAGTLTVNTDSYTLLGTLTTTSGTTQTLSGLDLTPYKFVFIATNGVSHNSATGQALVIGAASATNTNFPSANTLFSNTYIDLANGVVSGMGVATLGGDTGYRNSSTSIVFSWASGAAFDGGSIKLYGVK